jgi:hypothetical protein
MGTVDLRADSETDLSVTIKAYMASEGITGWHCAISEQSSTTSAETERDDHLVNLNDYDASEDDYLEALQSWAKHNPEKYRDSSFSRLNRRSIIDLDRGAEEELRLLCVDSTRLRG